jgi:hypothetical protein
MTLEKMLPSVYRRAGFLNGVCYATASGKMGIGPYGALSGDIVTIIDGGQFCYILIET